MEIKWNAEKANKLYQTRGIDVSKIGQSIESGTIIKTINHFNPSYPNQFIAYVWYKDYIHSVPYVKEKNDIFIKTVYPDGRATRRYLKGTL